MSWFKVDDGFYSHEKVLTIPRAIRAEAIGTWTLCGTWSADKDRDGYLPEHMIDELGASLAGAEALVAAKLWRRRGSGFIFVNWAEFQPTREEKADKRRAESQRKAEYRARKANDLAGMSENVPPGHMRDDVPPDPTRPDPKETKTLVEKVPVSEGGTGGRASRIPNPFVLTVDMRDWASREVPGIDPEAETRQFVDYWRASSGARARKVDWVAAWRYWMRNTNSRPRTRQTPTERAMATVAAGRAVAGRIITSLEEPKELAS